jgi:hypothetical protein
MLRIFNSSLSYVHTKFNENTIHIIYLLNEYSRMSQENVWSYYDTFT